MILTLGRRGGAVRGGGRRRRRRGAAQFARFAQKTGTSSTGGAAPRGPSAGNGTRGAAPSPRTWRPVPETTDRRLDGGGAAPSLSLLPRRSYLGRARTGGNWRRWGGKEREP